MCQEANCGIGLTGVWLSYRYREPIITAWSTPGAAFLVSVLPFTPYPEAIGAYMLSALGFVLLGVSGLFERIVKLIPPGIAAGLLAVNEWALRPVMVVARAHGSALGLTFGAWHGVSAVIYVLACFAVLVLIWREDFR